MDARVHTFRCVPWIVGSSVMRLAARAETLTEVDVFDGGIGVAKFVEPTDGGEARSAHGAEAGPERVGRSCARYVDVVVEQVAERRHGAVVVGRVVVRPEHRGQPRVAIERGPDACERVGVHLDVGIDEDEDVSGGALRRPGCAPPMRRVWSVRRSR